MVLRIGISLALALCVMVNGSDAAAIAKSAFVSSPALLKSSSCFGNKCGITSLQMKTASKSKKKGASSGGFGKAPGGFGKGTKTLGTETVDAALLLRQSMDLYDKYAPSSCCTENS
eukprot:1766293-Rhodomonas_salina.1